MDDGWVRYIRALPKEPIEGLYPILDSLTWPEDIEKYPPGTYPVDLSFFLFATPVKYYIYCYEDDDFHVAGDSMLEVYERMKVARFHGDKEGDWPVLEKHPAIEQLTDDYFPEYGLTKDHGIILLHPAHDFDEDYAKVMKNFASKRK
jgi:hypothetical protein